MPATSLTIEHISLTHGRMPVDMRLSYGSATVMPFCIASITAGGFTGTGEGLHADLTAAAALAQTLLGRDARQADTLVPPPPPPPFSWQICVIREMFSMALIDLAARAAGLPMWAHLGTRNRQHLPMMPCIFPASPQYAHDIAKQFILEGYTALKVKFLGDAQHDLAILAAVRSAVPDVYLQADVNAGYKTLPQALDILPQFKNGGLDVIEDPMAGPLELHQDLMALSNRPRIMLDMPTRGEQALINVCRLRCCDGVNLHPNMQGTLSETLQRASLCQEHALPIQVGGTGYTGIGAFTTLQIASVLPSPFPIGELGGMRDHGMPASTSLPLPHINHGHAILPHGHGHCGTLHTQWLSENTQTLRFHAD